MIDNNRDGEWEAVGKKKDDNLKIENQKKKDETKKMYNYYLSQF